MLAEFNKRVVDDDDDDDDGVVLPMFLLSAEPTIPTKFVKSKRSRLQLQLVHAAMLQPNIFGYHNLANYRK